MIFLERLLAIEIVVFMTPLCILRIMAENEDELLKYPQDVIKDSSQINIFPLNGSASPETWILKMPPTVVVPRGEEASLHCELKVLNGHHDDRYFMKWTFKAKDNDSLKVASFDQAKDDAPKVDGRYYPRVTMSFHANQSWLNFSVVTPDDFGSYHCVAGLSEDMKERVSGVVMLEEFVKTSTMMTASACMLLLLVLVLLAGFSIVVIQAMVYRRNKKYFEMKNRVQELEEELQNLSK
nr:PREDICTED: uncharacterized protein LOC106706668 [Latimeria chalumnae]|eukprot:XP_014353418.1 PREDICTED: uncharacterized protein LOC106706668 [Latimeria chalumnae]